MNVCHIAVIKLWVGPVHQPWIVRRQSCTAYEGIQAT